MFINFAPLYQYPQYGRLYIAQFISFFGSMMTYVALPYQVYQLTHSSFNVGLVGLIELIPLLLTSLWGGALADKVNRRYLILFAEAGLFLGCLTLCVNAALPHPSLYLIYCAAAINSGLNGIHRPSIESLTPVLLPPAAIPAVSALHSMKVNLGQIVGPALSGILIAHYGATVVYALDATTFFISWCAIYSLTLPAPTQTPTGSLVESIREGVQYAFSRQELIGSYVVDLIAMIFGMPMALFPAISEHLGGPLILGSLYAAVAAGALTSSFLSAWTAYIQRLGRAISYAAIIWGIAIIGFGLSTNLPFALLCLFFAGAADDISGIFRLTLWNRTIPTHLRGRLASIELISYKSGPLLGNAEAGFVAACFGVTASVVSGGVLCVVGVSIAVLLLPKFWHYQLGSVDNGNQ